MKIVLFDTEHFETAFALVRIFDIPPNDITIFTDEDTGHRMQVLLGNRPAGYTWIIRPRSQSNLSFIRKMYRSFVNDKPDLFILGTVSHHHFLHALYLKRFPPRQSLLTVHAINFLLHYPIRTGPRHVSRYLGNKLLLKQVTYLNVISETMIPHLENQRGVHQPVFHLPGTVFEGRAVSTPVQWPLRIVVPGTVDESRRDYMSVFELAQAAGDVHITLLGGPVGGYGRMVIDKASSYPNITTFDALVDQEEFEQRLSAAHFVWVPSVQESFSQAGVREIYGLTKSSGSLFDAIRHAKPLILPSHLHVPETLKKIAFRYNGISEILSLIRTLRGNPENYDTFAQQAFAYSMQFTPEEIRKKNSRLFPDA